METVVIDDVPTTGTSAGNIVIDVDEENSNDVIEVIEILPIRNDDQMAQVQEIGKENKALGELLEKCIALDTSGAMLRVINRTLIPLYKNHGCKFHNAMQKLTFERALTKALIQIEMDPMYKYSHIKEFCEVLKTLKEKKKVPFVTLSKKPKEKNNPFHSKRSRKRPRLDNATVINLVDDEFEEVPFVNSNVKESDVIALQSHRENEKENSSSNVNISVVGASGVQTLQQHFIEIDVENEIVFNICSKDKSNSIVDVDIPPENRVELPAAQSTFHNNFVPSVPQGHSVADTAVSCVQVQNQKDKNKEDLAQKIKTIETNIATFKKLVEEMSQREVTEDTLRSPYLQCEYYQLRIVKLYEQLCELTGRPSVKRREVRLRAADSRSQLPLKKLEKLINDNIGSDGLPHFPDFQEVVSCVREANEEGRLGWHLSQIMNEARSLFAHCGRALQRNRQRREWRDMRRLVKGVGGSGQGAELRDPADDDPQLRARLEVNQHDARVKETMILERFASLESRSRAAPIEVEENDNTENEDWDENQVRIVQVVSCDQTEVDSGTNNAKDLIELNNEKVQFATKSVADKDFTNFIGETNTVLILDPQFYNKVMSQVLVSSGIAANSALVRNNNEALTHIRVCHTDVYPKQLNRKTDPNDLNKNVQIANDVVHKDFTNHNGEYRTNQISDLSFISTVPQQVLGNSIITTNLANGALQCNDTLTQVGANKSHIEVLSIEIDNSPDEYPETNNNDTDITKTGENNESIRRSINSNNSEILSDRDSCKENNDSSNHLQEKPANDYVSVQSDLSESQIENTKVNNLEKNGCLLTKNVISNVKIKVNDTTDTLKDLSNSFSNTEVDNAETNLLETESLIASVKTEADHTTTELGGSSKTFNNTKDDSEETTSIDAENPEVKAEVKAEATDTIKELEDFGSDFTMTILDIEDPFLVIEISSDSSSEDDDDYFESHEDDVKERLAIIDQKHNET